MSNFIFRGDSESYISIEPSADTNMENEDFTIEWYQYQTDENPYPRVYQIGSYLDGNGNIAGGFSIEVVEGDIQSLIYWQPTNSSIFVESGTYRNQWIHFAIVRKFSSSSLVVYKNGVQLVNLDDNLDYTSGSAFTIGNETSRSNDASFGGLIKYFHIMKGHAKYNGNFTPSDDYPEAVAPYTKYLLRADKEPVGNNVTFSNVSYSPVVEPPPVSRRRRFSMYSNNLVNYRKGSLSTTVSSGVRNSRIIARRT